MHKSTANGIVGIFSIFIKGYFQIHYIISIDNLLKFIQGVKNNIISYMWLNLA